MHISKKPVLKPKAKQKEKKKINRKIVYLYLIH